MSFQIRIASLGGLFFQMGLYTPLQSMWFSYWYTGTDAPILEPKKGKYTFLYTDIFFFRLFPQFKIKKTYFQVRKYTLAVLNHSKTWETCTFQRFNPLDDDQHLTCNTTCCVVKKISPKKSWIHHWSGFSK